MSAWSIGEAGSVAAQLRLSRVRSIAAFTLATAIVTGLTDCGGEVVAVRVGRAAITREAVTRWMSVVAPEHFVPDPPRYTTCVAREQMLASPTARATLMQECGREYHALERQALEFLISSAWLTGTLAEEGLRVSDREVRERLREHQTPLAVEEGDAGDVEFAVHAELAEAKLRQALTRSEHMVTSAQIADYYRAHRRRFLVPERRYFDIENLKTRALALGIKREVQSGRRARFISGVLHEMIEGPSPVKYGRAEDAVRRAILGARSNVLTGPLANGEYALFEVRRIVAARYEPLARVRGAIEHQLAAEQRRLRLSRFIEAWHTRWVAMTDCYPGYVVQRCRQYIGPRAPEEPLAFSSARP